MRILITRPQAEAERTAARLIALGHEPVIAPVLRIERTEDTPPSGSFDALIVTSVNAVPALADLEDGRARQSSPWALGPPQPSPPKGLPTCAPAAVAPQRWPP